jgi:hypothetical protein
LFAPIKARPTHAFCSRRIVGTRTWTWREKRSPEERNPEERKKKMMNGRMNGQDAVMSTLCIVCFVSSDVKECHDFQMIVHVE